MAVCSRDYSNGKIYCIRNTITDDIYIGSTTQPLCKRIAKHRSSMKNERNNNASLYKKMNALGVENFYIELIEEYPCENNEQLRAREGHFIREMATLNGRIEQRTVKEWHEDNKDHVKAYKRQHYQENKEHILERVKTNTENNKEHVKQYQKEYHEKNKERIAQQRKEYREQNREKILQQKKEYRERKREEINRKRREKWQQKKQEANEQE